VCHLVHGCTDRVWFTFRPFVTAGFFDRVLNCHGDLIVADEGGWHGCNRLQRLDRGKHFLPARGSLCIVDFRPGSRFLAAASLPAALRLARRLD
jgi:hypothetical protein